jgi:acyl-CoA thioesterase I
MLRRSFLIGATGLIATGLIPVPASGSAEIVLDMYGDSTTLGTVLRNGKKVTATRSEPYYVRKILNETMSARVGNHGVAGSQAIELLKGKDGKHRPWAEEMARSNANVVSINYGVNDARLWRDPAKGREACSPEVFGDTIQAMVTIARQQGKLVILQEPNPSTIPESTAIIAKYVKAMRAAAKSTGTPIVAQFKYIRSLPDWESLYSDDVHPTTDLYRLKAERTARVILAAI